MRKGIRLCRVCTPWLRRPLRSRAGKQYAGIRPEAQNDMIFYHLRGNGAGGGSAFDPPVYPSSVALHDHRHPGAGSLRFPDRRWNSGPHCHPGDLNIAVVTNTIPTQGLPCPYQLRGDLGAFSPGGNGAGPVRKPMETVRGLMPYVWFSCCRPEHLAEEDRRVPRCRTRRPRKRRCTR